MTAPDRKAARAAANAARKEARQAQIASMSDVEKNRWAWGGFGVLVLVGYGVFSAASGADSEQSATTMKVSAASTATGCKGPTKSRDMQVTEEATILDAPRESARALTRTSGDETSPAIIDSSIPVRELCRSGTWSQVRVLAPQEFRHWRGWVPASSLQPVPVTASGRRIYRVSDFDWSYTKTSRRSSVTKVINTIMDQRPDCEAMDTRSLNESKVRGASQFSMQCDGPSGSISFDFTTADATNGRSFAPVVPIDKMASIEECERGVLTRAAHPSTVKFPILDYDFRDEGDGRSRLLMSVTAKNGLDLELSYDVQCDFTGSRLDKVLMSEAAE